MKTGKVNSWNKLSNNSVSVTQTGKYTIKFEDNYGSVSTKDTEVVLVNKPVLTDGMVPIVYDEDTNKWVEANQEDGKWYDYSENKWANIMLKDGNIQNSTASMFVWIPRYAYSITSNFHSNNEGNIDIKFLQGTTKESTDKINISNNTSSGLNNWIIHPAFLNASSSGYKNGGWKKAIEGIWVAKFEASSDTNGFIKVIPDVESWRGLTEEEMFQKCLNMNKEGVGNIYRISSNAITHQMKNSEWGAVAYLGYSQYGHNGELAVNNNAGYVTGNGYNSSGGQVCSTTGNVYGVYDLSGGAKERVAAYIEGGNTQINTTEKYLVDIYQAGYENNSTRFGDAIYETSSAGEGMNSWNDDDSTFPTEDDSIFSRGGLKSENTKAGIFAFSTGGLGEANDEYGFRPVIIVSN